MGVAMNMQWRRKRKLCSRPHSFGKYSDATKCAAKAATAVSFTLPLLTVRACAAIKTSIHTSRSATCLTRSFAYKQGVTRTLCGVCTSSAAAVPHSVQHYRDNDRAFRFLTWYWATCTSDRYLDEIWLAILSLRMVLCKALFH